jgi:hypothetical protein
MLEGYPAGIDDLDEDAFVLVAARLPKRQRCADAIRAAGGESARVAWQLSPGREGKSHPAFALSASWSSRSGPAIARSLVPIRCNTRRTRTRARVVSLQRTIKSPSGMEATVVIGGMVVRPSMDGHRTGGSDRRLRRSIRRRQKVRTTGLLGNVEIGITAEEEHRHGAQRKNLPKSPTEPLREIFLLENRSARV